MSQRLRCFAKRRSAGTWINKGRRQMTDVRISGSDAVAAELPAGIGQVVLVLQGGGVLGAY